MAWQRRRAAPLPVEASRGRPARRGAGAQRGERAVRRACVPGGLSAVSPGRRLRPAFLRQRLRTGGSRELKIPAAASCRLAVEPRSPGAGGRCPAGGNPSVLRPAGRCIRSAGSRPSRQPVGRCLADGIPSVLGPAGRCVPPAGSPPTLAADLRGPLPLCGSESPRLGARCLTE